MYYDYEPEVAYYRKGALEINIQVREREKHLALLAAELKVEEDHLLEQKPNPVMGFLSNLFGGLRTSDRQLAGATRK